MSHCLSPIKVEVLKYLDNKWTTTGTVQVRYRKCTVLVLFKPVHRLPVCAGESRITATVLYESACIAVPYTRGIYRYVQVQVLYEGHCSLLVCEWILQRSDTCSTIPVDPTHTMYSVPYLYRSDVYKMSRFERISTIQVYCIYRYYTDR